MDLTKEQLLFDAFFKSHTRLQYKKGETIIRPEDDPSGIFLIEWGFIKAYTITKYGEENVLLVRGQGGIFPMIWLFTDEHRHVSYEAMEDAGISREKLSGSRTSVFMGSFMNDYWDIQTSHLEKKRITPHLAMGVCLTALSNRLGRLSPLLTRVVPRSSKTARLHAPHDRGSDQDSEVAVGRMEPKRHPAIPC